MRRKNSRYFLILLNIFVWSLVTYLLIIQLVNSSFFHQFLFDIKEFDFEDFDFKHKEKLILIGIDAAEWEIINQLIQEGHLPNFKSFVEEGSYGTLHSPHCYSPISWTEILSGATKEKHQVDDFVTSDGTRPINRYDVQVKRIWDYLDDNNIGVGVYHHYFLWPVKQVHGFMISDLNHRRGYNVYPDSLENLKSQINFSYNSINDISKECQLILSLFKDFKPEFYTFFDGRIHATTHSYWKYLYPKRFNITDKEEINEGYEKIIRVYSKWDECFGLIEYLANDYDIMIVSDHGMGDQLPISYHVEFQQLFQDLGLEDKFLKPSYHLFITQENGKYSLEFKLMNKSGDVKHIKKLFEEMYYLDGSDFFENITIHSNSIIAYIGGSDFKNNLILNISKYNIFLEYYMPIIIKSENISSFIWIWEKSGEHPPGTDGVIVAKGPNINENFKITNATVYDITPTILYLYNLPMPEDMDGRVLKEIIKPETKLRLFWNIFFWNHQAINIEKNEEIITNIPKSKDEASLEILRRLGYLV